MVMVGVHVSISGSIDKAVDRARERGCDTFQIFTRNPRGWKYTKLKKGEVAEFIRKVEEYGINPPVAHMPYLPNISCPKKDIYNKSVKSLIMELERCEALRIPYLVTHLGSHLGKGYDVGFERLVNAISTALHETSGQVMLLLENTAGQKNSMGSRFEELRKILDAFKAERRVGTCFDTCHSFAAGYDLRTEEAAEATLDELDRVIGFDRVKVIHLNDSASGCGRGLDRHEHIGLGYIGERGFRAILRDGRIKKLPLIMETPVDKRRDDLGNIRKVRELAGEV